MDEAVEAEPIPEPESLPVFPELDPPEITRNTTWIHRHFPAVHAEAFHDRVVIHEPSEDDAPLRLTARSLLSGEVLWATVHPGEGRRSWIQAFDDERLLVRAEHELQLVDIQTGRVVVSYADYTGRGRYLWRRDGVCLLSDECGVDVIDCDSAKPLRSLRIGYSNRRRNHGIPSSRCFGGATIVGRSGETLIVAMNNWSTDRVPRQTHSRTGSDAWVGIDASSGALRWHVPYGCRHCVGTETGVVGTRAWFRTQGRLSLIDAASGALVSESPSPDLQEVFVEQRNLLLLFSNRLMRLDPLTGEQTLVRAIAAGTLAATVHAVHPGSRLEGRRFLWLDGDGEVLHSQGVPEGSFVYPGAAHARWHVGETATFDEDGRPVQTQHFQVRRRSDTQQANVGWHEYPAFAEFEHDAWKLGETVLPRPLVTAAVLAVLETGPPPADSVRRVHLFWNE